MNTGNSYIKVNVGGSPSKSTQIMRTGQTTSGYKDSDGDVERGRNTGFLTLGYNNNFGNNDRLTDTLGTQIYADDVILDWSSFDPSNSTVLAYYRVVQPATAMTIIANNSPYTFNTYADWKVPNFNELVNVFYHESNNYEYLIHAPFNITIGAISGIWTSTKGRTIIESMAYNGKGILSFGNSTTLNYILVRRYTLTELGL
tara:strand:- start:171 stop:773 length:603 start_codon:yes stop_codon:yes gene_type:complete